MPENEKQPVKIVRPPPQKESDYGKSQRPAPPVKPPQVPPPQPPPGPSENSDT